MPADLILNLLLRSAPVEQIAGAVLQRLIESNNTIGGGLGSNAAAMLAGERPGGDPTREQKLVLEAFQRLFSEGLLAQTSMRGDFFCH